MTELKVGMRLRSVTCTTEVIVIRTRAQDADLRCGGYPMVDLTAEYTRRELLPDWNDGTRVGKRYEYSELGLEVLCTRAGAGSLAIGTVPLTVAEPKKLPSSD